MSKDLLEKLTKSVKYKNWDFQFKAAEDVDGSDWLLSVRFWAKNGSPLRGRWWHISAFATSSEVVQTMLLAVLTAEEHEAREQFLFEGKAIYSPHKSIKSLTAAYDEDRRATPQTT